MGFDTQIEEKDGVFSGPFRKPANMLAKQSVAGQKTIHDDDGAEDLGFKPGLIEGPTHFSQFDALFVKVWGQAWFERGCISAHYMNMVYEGDDVRAFVKPLSDTQAECWAEKTDGTRVLEASASLGPDHGETLLEARMSKSRPAGQLVILEDMQLGPAPSAEHVVRMDPDQIMAESYPFSLNEKLERITENSPWYSQAEASPWGRPIIPTEMVSVLIEQTLAKSDLPIKSPSISIFADQQIRYINGPLLVSENYIVRREVVAISQSRRAENYWLYTKVYDATGETLVADSLINRALLKDSYDDYPPELLAK